MEQSQLTDIIGFIAAGIGVMCFMPQALKVFQTKETKSISLPTFLLLSLVSVLWLIYGFLIKSNPLIFVNLIVLVLTTYIVLMKLKHG